MDKVPGEIVAQVADIFSRNFGFRLDSPIIYSNIEKAIITRMNDCSIDDPRRYLTEKLGSVILHKDEINQLFRLVSVNETFFFRLPEHYRVLKSLIIPELLSAQYPSNCKLSIWSAGCSTGEEPYSIAIECAEFEKLYQRLDLTLLGTDMDPDTIAHARTAIYHKRALMGTPDSIARAYWAELADSRHVLSPLIKNKVRFELHNLCEPSSGPFLKKWDVIFCRNVLIYFNDSTIAEIMRNFHQALSPGGYLVVGPWETRHCPASLFIPIEKYGTFIFKRRENKAAEPQKSAAQTHLLPQQPSHLQPTIQEIRQSVIALRNSSRLGEALSLIDKHLPHNPANYELHYLKGIIAGDMTNHLVAESSFREALRINCMHINTYLALAMLYRATNASAQAVETLQRALSIDRDNILARYFLAQSFSDRGDSSRAIEEIRMVRAALSKNSGPLSCDDTMPHFTPSSLIGTCDNLIRKWSGSI